VIVPAQQGQAYHHFGHMIKGIDFD
jgi:hypothetical protein